MFGKMKKTSVLLTLCAMLMLVFGAVLVNWRNWSVDASAYSADSLSRVTFSAVDGTGSTGTEGYAKAVDGRKSSSNFTKWCTAISGNPYIVIKASEQIILSGYDFTTGNDNADATKGAGRNPKNWTLSACSDYNETSNWLVANN